MSKILENPYTGERLTFMVTAEETDGERLQVRHYAPRPTVMGVAHFHPILTETFTVEQGRLSFKVDGRVHTLNAGDSITIQPGRCMSLKTSAMANWFCYRMYVLLEIIRPCLR